MTTLDKLLKIVSSYNVVDTLDEEEQKKIVKDAIIGYEIDLKSRENWLENNKKAIKMIKTAENADIDDSDKDFPFPKSSKVVFPLIQESVIQLASRLIQHITRNDRVGSCTTIGADPDGSKQAKADRVTDFMSYEMLIKSDTWLLDQHKLCHILASWGTAFKEMYFDTATQTVCHEILQPEDVVLNQGTISLDKCPRFTIRKYLTKNDILTAVRRKQFSEPDFDLMLVRKMEGDSREQDTQETNPVYEIKKQFAYLDLDDDDYREPYFIYFHKESEQLLGIYPAFEMEDIIPDDKGQVISITPRQYLVDYHLINDPEGKFYSLGMNLLLLHLNASITCTLRQLIDSGTLANVQGGFITKAFKTREKHITPKMGKFTVLDVGGAASDVDLSKQILPLPFKEPSQVLLALLQTLITSGKEAGFISDLLTGDTDMQNVPATTMLAAIEQQTRAFKPVVQKLYQSEKKELKYWFHLRSINTDNDIYFKFLGGDKSQDPQRQQQIQMISRDDFDEDELDIIPVADPTMASEAHKYARLQAIIQLFGTQAIGDINIQQALTTIFTELQFPNPQSFVQNPQNKAPDPRVLHEQNIAKQTESQQEIEHLKALIAARKIDDVEVPKVKIKEHELGIKHSESTAKTAKVLLDAHKADTDAVIKAKNTDIQQQEANNNSVKLRLMADKQRNSGSSEKDK